STRRRLASEGRDPRAQRRELEVAYLRLRFAGRGPRALRARARGSELRLARVEEPRGRWRHGEAPHVVHGDQTGANPQPQRARRGEDDLTADGIEIDLLAQQGATALRQAQLDRAPAR